MGGVEDPDAGETGDDAGSNANDTMTDGGADGRLVAIPSYGDSR